LKNSLTLLLTVYLFSINIINGQSYDIEYLMSIDYGSSQVHTTYLQIISNEGSYALEVGSEYTSVYKMLPPSNQEKQFVLYLPHKSVIYNNQPIFSKIFIVKDKTPSMKWVMKPDTKDILGLKCQLAEVEFRGRKYNLWISTDLSVVGGVWKFVGLPGYVMAAYSQDQKIAIEVKSITPSMKEIVTIDEILKENKNEIVSWDSFEAKFRHTVEKLKKSYEAESNSDIEHSFEIFQVEIIGQ
jgi:GLPGLI family protein